MIFIDFYSRSRKGLLFRSSSGTIAWLQAVPALAPQHYLEVQAFKWSTTISVFWIRIRNFFQGTIRNDKMADLKHYHIQCSKLYLIIQ